MNRCSVKGWFRLGPLGYLIFPPLVLSGLSFDLTHFRKHRRFYLTKSMFPKWLDISKQSVFKLDEIGCLCTFISKQTLRDRGFSDGNAYFGTWHNYNGAVCDSDTPAYCELCILSRRLWFGVIQFSIQMYLY